MKQIFSLLLLAVFATSSVAQPPCSAIHLRCEYLSTPLGIDMHDPRLSWQLEDDRQGAAQTAYRIEVATDSATLAGGQANAWRSGKIASARTNGIRYAGASLRSRTRYFWRVTVWDKDGRPARPSSITTFETGIFSYPEWKGEWISDGQDTAYFPAPYFRKAFSVRAPIREARAYICGLGYYEMSINGKRVGDHVLDPTYSRFDKRSYYSVYDVTSMLQEGGNAVGVLLGNGWFNEQSRAVWNFHKAPWRDRPKLLCNIYIQYEDGSTACIATDTSWRTAPSAILFNNIYAGEYVDDRVVQKGWDMPGFSDTAWQNASTVVPVPGELRAQLVPPVRVKKQIATAAMKKLNDSLYVFDLGQNFSGLSRLRVAGKRGTVISLQHGEELSKEGRLDNYNIGVHYRFANPWEAPQTDTYILSGDGTEEFTQRFTYHGYRYVEIQANAPIDLDTSSLTGLFIHTDLEPTGSFSCSDTLINRIFNAGIWSYLSNAQGIPTDCPHREKNGWTGDGHIAAEVGMYNFDALLFYEKWINDFLDEQQRNGEIAPIIPTSGWGYNFHNGVGPVWDAAFLLIPWYVYEYYGDDHLIRKGYDQYKKYVDYLRFRADSNHIQRFGLWDWSPYKSRTPIELTSTAYYYQIVTLLSRFAKITDRRADAATYGELASRIRHSINTLLFDASKGIYANGTQTALSTALDMEIVPDKDKQRVLDNLVKALAANDDHLDVGMIGSKHLLNALSSNGLAELAFKVAAQRTRPSWGWWLLQGETTFQEEWALGPSRNHIFLGEILAWFYKALAGIKIDPEKPGFSNILIEPHFVKALDHAEASVETVQGKVSVRWKRSVEGKIELDIVIPPNSSATVTLPATANRLLKAGKYHFSAKY